MKEQTRNTEVQINEKEIGWKRIQNNDSKDGQKPWKQNGENEKTINKDLEELKNKHTNNTITEIKNILEGINSRIFEAEEWISELEDKITSEEQNKIKGMKGTEDSLRDHWEYIKYANICIIGVPEEEKKKGYEKFFEEIVVENFPNMEKEIVHQVQRHKESHTG